jgi:nuclear pore complex protein Nup107
MLPPLKDPLSSIITLQAPASDAETFLLRSIEWTTFLESTFEVALEQATVILRYFLGMLLSFQGVRFYISFILK